MSVKTTCVAAIIATAVGVPLAAASGLEPSAYSADYVGTTLIAPQQISATSFYTDVSLSAQSATVAAFATS